MSGWQQGVLEGLLEQVEVGDDTNNHHPSIQVGNGSEGPRSLRLEETNNDNGIEGTFQQGRLQLSLTSFV